MPFSYPRTVHFSDTDAPGVVFFANYLAICHEACEESLAASGINLTMFFSDTDTVVPISRSEASYKRPLACGDKLRIARISEEPVPRLVRDRLRDLPGRTAREVSSNHPDRTHLRRFIEPHPHHLAGRPCSLGRNVVAKIPHPPRAKLCGAVWFARIRQKAILLGAGELPPEYVARFCHPTGVDAQFLRFFALTREYILATCILNDEELETWFLGRPGNCRARPEEWNHVAVNMGRPGFPMTERLPIAKSTTYSHIPSAHIETVFELLEADEGITLPF